MLAALLLSCLLLADPPYANDRQIAPSWSAFESTAYQVSIDRKIAHGGRASLSLKSTGAGDAQGYAARQRIRAAAWRGKKIRVSGWIKTDRIESGGGAIWLRIDTANGDYILDGMIERRGQGLEPRRSGGPDPPDDAVGITFGARMIGTGQMWADDFQMEPAPAQGTHHHHRAPEEQGHPARGRLPPCRPPAPGNLGFEQ